MIWQGKKENAAGNTLAKSSFRLPEGDAAVRQDSRYLLLLFFFRHHFIFLVDRTSLFLWYQMPGSA
jgi:hypothetical protein